jgi:hypothetical protein
VEFPAVTEFRGGVAVREKSAKNIDMAILVDCWPLVPVTEKSVGLALDAESPLTVKALLPPGVMGEGRN